ncbi:hypothetical protein E4U43_003255 [Claviceps pusilla]|uniref:Pentatricopeptide repeat-containing protein-mitochondrial domain-containing protein n=1 Tax=Claviceps pusilla TaxID=123648 RepID=A0A9P7N5N1_9HYPO|nr:hypothetical protein E4U43_003255 [Claviceps pusilla]
MESSELPAKPLNDWAFVELHCGIALRAPPSASPRFVVILGGTKREASFLDSWISKTSTARTPCGGDSCGKYNNMRGSPIVYDGLWRCLCPGFDKLALRQAVAVNNLESRRRHLASRDGARRVTTVQSRVFCLELPGKRLMTTQSWSETAIALRDSTSSSLTSSSSSSPPPPPPPHNPAKDGYPPYEPLLEPMPPTDETLRQASLDDIVAALLTMRQPEGWDCHGREIDRYSRILLLVHHLLLKRGQAPSLFIYECIMDAMVDPQGSVKGIRKLFEDLASRNMKPTSQLCQSALAALTNHPDYVLRQDILNVMHEYWFTIDTGAKQSLVLGLLRDEQYELAYLRLTEMMDQKVHIDFWVYDIFIVVFGKLRFLDEMLLLLYRRKSLVSEDKDIASILYYALDVCSQAFYYPGTMFAWNTLVRTSLLQPADGIVENVLATAARHGDTTLATDALDKIAQRTRLLPHHFESVMEAFSADGDLTGAFRTLCVMQKNGIPVVRGNTRAVYEALTRYPTLIQDAEQSLRSLVSPEQRVPLAAAAVVIEALAETRGTEAAMDLYNDLPRLCGEPADPAMIQTLILHSRDTDTTRSLVRDYTAHTAASAAAAAAAAAGDDAIQNPSIYKALVTACAKADALDLAFHFALQAVDGAGAVPDKDKQGPEPQNLDWLKVLLGKAVEVEDARIWTIVDKLRTRDEDSGMELTKMLRQARIMKRASTLGGR